jgi:aminomethyltransferase
MDPNAYQAIREHAAWIDLSGRGKIRATGEDRVRLMHAMCTNHIEELQPGTGCYAFFLTAQGRILADANVFCMPDYLLIDTEPEARQKVLEHLDRFIIADDVALHDFTEATATIAVEGPDAERVLKEHGAVPAHLACSMVEWGRSDVAHCTYTGGPGYTIFVPAEEKAEVVRKLALPQADLETADVVRLEHGRPRYGIDFTDANIPHETQQLQAVHFSKGCYIGQEIVERVRSRGQVNRLLTRIEIDAADAPSPGAKVMTGDKEAGAITSAAFSPGRGKVVGFAILRAESLRTPLTLNGSSVTPLT